MWEAELSRVSWPQFLASDIEWQPFFLHNYRFDTSWLSAHAHLWSGHTENCTVLMYDSLYSGLTARVTLLFFRSHWGTHLIPLSLRSYYMLKKTTFYGSIPVLLIIFILKLWVIVYLCGCSCPHWPGEGAGPLGLVLEAVDVGIQSGAEEAGIGLAGLCLPSILWKLEAHGSIWDVNHIFWCAVSMKEAYRNQWTLSMGCIFFPQVCI